MCLEISTCVCISRQCQDVYTQWWDMSVDLDMYTLFLDMSEHCLDTLVLSMAPFHLLGDNEQIKVKHYFSLRWGNWYLHCCHVMLTVSSMANFFQLVKTTEARSDMTLWSHDAVGICTGDTWHWWYCQWHHFVWYIKIIETKCNIPFWSHDTSVGITWQW